MLGSILCGPHALVRREYFKSPCCPSPSASFLNFLYRRFKTTDVAAVMDHDSPSGSSSSDFDTEDDRSSKSSPVPQATTREKPTSVTRRSMRGLQIAISEGWLVQRARDMCSFAHDRYRQAAEAEALSLPDDLIAKMSFRVGIFLSHSKTITKLSFQIISMMLLEPCPDVYQIAERAQRYVVIYFSDSFLNVKQVSTPSPRT